MLDPLKGKRAALADAMNWHLDTTFYSADHHDIASLPEPVLDQLLEHYSMPERHQPAPE